MKSARDYDSEERELLRGEFGDLLEQGIFRLPADRSIEQLDHVAHWEVAPRALHSGRDL